MKVRRMLVDSSKYNVKCPYTMEAKFIIVHNTANDASANNEVSYMIRNNNEVSFHYAVDDIEVVQGIPEDRNSWNAGDGASGNGNRNGIAIEICYSKSGGDRFIKAERNAAKFIAQKLNDKGWGIYKVCKHQDFSNKYCPHRTLDMGWKRFLNMVQKELDKLNGNNLNGPEIPDRKYMYKLGETVLINGVYTSSTSNSKLRPLKGYGKITKIVDAANPYLLDDGNLGWINDDCVIKKGQSSTPTSNIKVGDYVKPIKAISYEGIKLASFVTENRYKVIEVRGNRVVLGGINTAFHVNNLSR